MKVILYTPKPFVLKTVLIKLDLLPLFWEHRVTQIYAMDARSHRTIWELCLLGVDEKAKVTIQPDLFFTLSDGAIV